MLLAIAATMAVASGAQAQSTGYPPPRCSVTFSTQVLGTVTVGSSVVYELIPTCEWTPGAEVSVSVNDVFIGAKAPGANGSVRVLVEALSATQLSIDDPVLVPAREGDNVIRATGVSAAAGTVVTHEGRFRVVDLATVTPTSVAKAKRSSGLLAFTGANLLILVAAALLAILVGTLLALAARRRAHRA